MPYNNYPYPADPYRSTFYDTADYSFNMALAAYRNNLIPFNNLHHGHLTQNYWDKQFKDMRRLYSWDPVYLPPRFNRYSDTRSAYRPIYIPAYLRS